MNIDVMKNFEVDEDGNAIKRNPHDQHERYQRRTHDWKKLVTVVFNILATLPVSAFGTSYRLCERYAVIHLKLD